MLELAVGSPGGLVRAGARLVLAMGEEEQRGEEQRGDRKREQLENEREKQRETERSCFSLGVK